MSTNTHPLRPLRWVSSNDFTGLELIDQTQLPNDVTHLHCDTVESVWHAIKRLSVRGAPAIGVAAAYGVIVALNETGAVTDWRATVDKACDYLATSRPTAVNLFWALDRMRAKAAGLGELDFDAARDALLAEAHAIRDEDAAMCAAIGNAGKHLIPEGGGVLTHCNAGALATSERGTALSVMYAAHEDGKQFTVYADETRPLLQGARLTTWELMQSGVDTVLICDNMAAVVMREKKVHVVVTGADRIAANGDAANKIGTYGVALLAKAHGIPFYIAAPSSTFDLSLASGDEIPIEEREADEIRAFGARPTAPDGVRVYNPAFDVTPAELIAGIITEKGLISPVSEAKIGETLASAGARSPVVPA